MRLRRLFLFFVCCCQGFFIQAQATLEKGVVHDSILVSGTTDETFAVYLPNSFTATKPSSLVVVFEPAARGAKGIQLFIDASEKYGHLLVCSNNSRNGPYDRNFGIANRLFDHIFDKFLVNQDEMYLSGFSGGSRLVSAIASLTDRFAGVVGCGAGFSNVPEHMPSIQTYAYVGLCGDRDMNYKEMLDSKKYLDLRGFTNTLITFDGKHRWPPKEQITRAMDWLYLQKLKNNESPQPEDLAVLYKSDYDRIQEFKDKEQFLFASEQYERILKDYKGHLNLDSLIVEQQFFLSSKSYKNQSAALVRALNQEQKLKPKLVKQMSLDFKTPSKMNSDWWEKEMAKLDRLKEKGDKETQKMIYRLKFDLFGRVYARKNPLMHTTDKPQAELVEAFLEIIYPKSD
ncbi:hypothetical protein [Flagellimonas eckloniae]|uniref:Phospholipase/carboxylesterase/thioesterase domain-containing protein n=1 Tax=Flagellimonas eckloniae TaxID=346185 RepID=A0A0Q0WZ36_9FLAO|nr:hypothetical protein [Allomuricauda eckloniae]KQC30710.1 hypothetical protein AAY42_13080 [Allomuricauda eckloniae]